MEIKNSAIMYNRLSIKNTVLCDVTLIHIHMEFSTHLPNCKVLRPEDSSAQVQKIFSRLLKTHFLVAVIQTLS